MAPPASTGGDVPDCGRQTVSQAEELLLALLGASSDVQSIVRAALIALSLAVLLTWLLLSSLGPDGAEEMAVQRALDDNAIGELRMHRDALSARAGLSRDDDALLTDTGMIRRSAARLIPLVGDMIPDIIQRFRDICAEQEALATRFKSRNDRLQTSLVYFDRLSARLDAEPNSALATTLRDVIHAVMHLIRDARPGVVRAVQERLDKLQTEAGRPDRPAIEADIVQHGLTLLELVPQVDTTLGQLLGLSTTFERDAVRAHFQHQTANQEAEAKRYRILLYLVALSLLIVLLRLGWLLRNGTLALRERAATERLIARTSTRFIACHPEDIGARIIEALAVIGGACGADRAYVIRIADPTHVQLWSCPDCPVRAGWPEALNDIVAEIVAMPGDVISLSKDSRGVPNALASMLENAAVNGWVAVKLHHERQVAGLLCIDEPRQNRASFDAILGLMRLAGIVVSHAVERERIFEERMALESRLQQAQRLQTVGTLASGVAHNFNNIIGVMLGHAEMALDDLAPESTASSRLKQVMQAGERARELIARILDFGRGRPVNRSHVSVDMLVAETVTMIEASLRDIQVGATGNAQGACVAVEAAELQQVLVNLIRNAAQASEPGGRVLVSISRHRVRQRRVLSHGAISAGEYVSIRVTDHGSGIEAGALRNMFQPFFTTRPAGTGLGLATAQEVVRESGGAFDVRSAPGYGSTFEFWLPIVAPDRPASAGSVSGHGESVMIVGSDQASIVRDEDTLAAFGYEPTGFSDPETALAAIRAAPDRFRIFVVNEFLPDRAGLDFVEALRSMAPDAPIVLSSFKPNLIRAETLASLRIGEVVVRPWRPGAIATALSQALNQSGAAAGHHRSNGDSAAAFVRLPES